MRTWDHILLAHQGNLAVKHHREPTAKQQERERCLKRLDTVDGSLPPPSWCVKEKQSIDDARHDEEE